MGPQFLFISAYFLTVEPFLPLLLFACPHFPVGISWAVSADHGWPLSQIWAGHSHKTLWPSLVACSVVYCCTYSQGLATFHSSPWIGELSFWQQNWLVSILDRREFFPSWTSPSVLKMKDQSNLPWGSESWVNACIHLSGCDFWMGWICRKIYISQFCRCLYFCQVLASTLQ